MDTCVYSQGLMMMILFIAPLVRQLNLYIALVLVPQTIEQELKDLAFLRRKQIILQEVLKIASANAVMLALLSTSACWCVVLMKGYLRLFASTHSKR
jgi:hypothetical protein